MFWLIVILIIAVSVTLLVMQQKGLILGGKKRPELPSAKRNIFNLQIGDIVQYLDRDWVVEGRLIYEEDGDTWLEYMLQDGDDIRWLSVEEDDVVEVAFLEPNNQLDIAGKLPKTFNFADENYTRVNSGKANMSREGNIVRRKTQKCKYYDYESDNGKVLSIEFWGETLEVTVGEKINPRSLNIFPGDGSRVYSGYE
ncbi:MAG: DUF4178 domain-containing protein [Crocosphaera sp.]